MLINLLLFVAAGATLSLLLWSGMELFQHREDPLADRLEELQSQALVVTQRTTRRKSATGLDRIQSAIALFPGGDDWMRGSERLLQRAGVRGRHALSLYLTGTLLFVLALLSLMLWLERGNDLGSMLGGTVAALLLGFLLPKMVLQRLVKRYRSRLQEALPDTVDLLGIVLGTGLALDQAMMRVSEEMQFVYPELALEFTTVVMQVRAGQERAKSFDQLVRRTGIESIKSLAAMIIQSEKFGTSLALALKVYADDLRKKRTRKAEEAVAKAAIKMLFPVLIFILPVLFIITLVPAVLTVVRNLQLLGGPK